MKVWKAITRSLSKKWSLIHPHLTIFCQFYPLFLMFLEIIPPNTNQIITVLCAPWGGDQIFKILSPKSEALIKTQKTKIMSQKWQ